MVGFVHLVSSGATARVKRTPVQASRTGPSVRTRPAVCNRCDRFEGDAGHTVLAPTVFSPGGSHARL